MVPVWCAGVVRCADVVATIWEVVGIPGSLTSDGKVMVWCWFDVLVWCRCADVMAMIWKVVGVGASERMTLETKVLPSIKQH